jgi:hypothetical protein
MSALVEAVSAVPMINHENYYSELTQGRHAYFELGAFELEMGETLPGAKLAYKIDTQHRKMRHASCL